MVFQYNHRNWLPEIASECQVKATEVCEVRETQLLLPRLGFQLMKFRGGKRKTRFFKYFNFWPKDQNNEFQGFHMFSWFNVCMVSWLLKKSDPDSREMSWLTWLSWCPITISAAKPYERFCDPSVWGPRGGYEKCNHTVIFDMHKDMFELFSQAFSPLWMCSVSVFPLKILAGMCCIAKLQAPTFPGSFSSFSLWSEPWNAVFFGQCNLEDCRGRGWSWFRWWWLRLENDRFAGSMESPESDQDDKRRRWLWICSRKIHVISILQDNSLLKYHIAKNARKVPQDHHSMSQRARSAAWFGNSIPIQEQERRFDAFHKYFHLLPKSSQVRMILSSQLRLKLECKVENWRICVVSLVTSAVKDFVARFCRRTSRPSQLRSSRLFNGFADNVDFFQIRKGTDFHGHLMHVRIYQLLVAVCTRVFNWKRRLWCRCHGRVHMVIQMLYREQLLSMVRGAIVKESKARKILPKVGFENFLKQALYDFEVWTKVIPDGDAASIVWLPLSQVFIFGLFLL